MLEVLLSSAYAIDLEGSMERSDAYPPKSDFYGGLLWYLETRNWAHEKMRSCPHGSHPFDVRMYHSLYFVNLFSAIDHVFDYLKNGNEERACSAFMARIETIENYQYVRELRNAIVHRGLDPTTAGHSDCTTLHVLCPPVVQDRQGRRSYTPSLRYLVELADQCDAVVNPAIADVLNQLDLFNPATHIIDEQIVQTAISNSTEMPDWSKVMAAKAIGENYAVWTAKIAATNIQKMRGLLGQT